MFCGEIATLIFPVDVDVAVGWGFRVGDARVDEVGFAGRTCSRRRRRWRWCVWLGLGGFCLRHCAISSRWLNRSFASSSLFTCFRLLLPFLFLLFFFLSRSRFAVLSFNALFSLSLSVVPDAVLGLSAVTYALRKVSFRPRCHALALRLEASTFLHFPVRHAYGAFPFRACCSLSLWPLRADRLEICLVVSVTTHASHSSTRHWV